MPQQTDRHVLRGLPVDAVLAAARRLVTDTVAATGSFRFGTHTGILICQ